MSVIKAEDIAYVRFRAPDLGRMRTFLQDFGLLDVKADGSSETLHMRGRGTAPFVHVTEQGEPAFVATGFRAASIEDLERLARYENVDVQPCLEPGGGSIVRLTDPDGFGVEVVAGQTPVDALPIDPHTAWNHAHEQPRQRAIKRTGAGSATVVRLGHGVLNVSDFRRSEAWYKERFGFITSDEIVAGPDISIAAFMRCDRADQPTDHHTLFLIQLPNGKAGFNHAAFEVRDMDDLMRGHRHLKTVGAEPEWGVGRHFLGSQVFDYWRDPWGFTLEHWTDGDLFTAADGSRTATVEELMGVQWGPDMPATLTA